MTRSVASGVNGKWPPRTFEPIAPARSPQSMARPIDAASGSRPANNVLRTGGESALLATRRGAQNLEARDGDPAPIARHQVEDLRWWSGKIHCRRCPGTREHRKARPASGAKRRVHV